MLLLPGTMAGPSLARRVVPWLLALGVAGGGAAGYVVWQRKKVAAQPAYRTVKASRGDISAKVTATGTLSARVTVQVGSQVSGRVQELFADFNSQVKKGQVIAKLDARLLQAALGRARASHSQARGQLAKARANLAQAERNLARVKQLAQQGLAGTAELESATTAVETAQADVSIAKGSVEQAAASLAEAQVNVDLTTIVSPIDGIVLSRSVDVGQTVAASLQAPVLFTIAQDLQAIQVDTYVSEADVGKLRPGMEATFGVDAHTGQKFKGTIRDIRNASQTVQNVVTYDAVLDVLNEDLKLKPGMTANVTFIVAEAKGALTVPNSALRFRPPNAPAPSGSWSGRPRGGGPPGGGQGRARDDSTRKTVWVLRGGAATPMRVETGVTDGTSTEIVSGGLTTDDDVIVEALGDAGAVAKPTTGGLPGMTPTQGGGPRGGRGF